MKNFQFIKSDRAYETKFFQFPQILLYGEQYKKLSDSAKLGYMVLRDRLNYSLENNWIDENNNVYFIFTNQELKSLFNWSNDKLNKVKKIWKKANLLFQKNMGFDPHKKKNIPNRLYLADLEVTAKDVYAKNVKPTEINGNPKFGHRVEILKPFETNGNPKFGYREKILEPLDNSGNPKIGHNLYNTKDIKDTYIDTEKERIQNSILLENFSKTFNNPFLGTDCLERIGHFSNTIQEAQNTVGIIMRAKNQVEKTNNTVIVAEYYQDEVKLKLTELYLKIKTDETIKSKDNYMFIAFLKMFKDFVNAEQAANNTFKSSFHIPIE